MNILLIDDEHLEVEQLEYLIAPHFPNWTIFKAYDASQAIQIYFSWLMISDKK